MKAVITAMVACLMATQASADTVGTASWYAMGHKTASGEKYDRHKMTAASRTLPFGTRVLVRRVDGKAYVIVRINDRGPFVRGRIIDLSEAAGHALGMKSCGVVKVVLEIIHDPD